MAKRRRPSPTHKAPAAAKQGGRSRSQSKLADPAWGEDQRGLAALSHDQNLDIPPPQQRERQRPASAASARSRNKKSAGPAQALSAARRAPSNVETVAETELPPPPGRAGAIGFLTCVAGSEKGQKIDLQDGVYGVGRGRDNHFVLKDIAASRQHIELRVNAGEVVVHDLGSGNGTKLNGRRVQSATLRANDRIEIGNSALVYTPLKVMASSPAQASVPPSPVPSSADLWPETESLLAELEEYEQAARQPAARRSSTDVIQGRRHSQSAGASARAMPVNKADPAFANVPGAPAAQSLSEIRAAIGAPSANSTNRMLIVAAVVLVVVVILGLFLLLSQVKNGASDEAAALLMRGHQALILMHYDESHKLFDQAQVLDPENPEVAKAQTLLARYEQSHKAYTRAIELLKKKDFDDARHALEGVLPGTPRAADVNDTRRRIDQAEADALLRQAQALYDKGKLDLAEKQVEKARIISPGREAAEALAKLIQSARKTAQQAAEQAAQQAQQPVPEPAPKAVVHKPVPRRHRARTRPRSRSRRSARLSDSAAKSMYKDALRAYKRGDKSSSRSLLKKIIRGTKSGSLYHEKAQSFIVRKL